MRKIAIALTLIGFAALTAVGQQSTSTNTSRSNVKNNIKIFPDPNGKIHCTLTTAGKTAPCTASELAKLNAALSSGQKAGTPSSSVKTVALAKDGSLMCTTGSGTVPCTSSHLTDLTPAYSRVNSELEQATQDVPAAK